MKTSRSAALAAVLLATGVSTPCALLAETTVTVTTTVTEPSTPVGSLSATPRMVQPGVKPMLNWNITYPSIVQDYVKVDKNKIDPLTDMYMDVRVLGAGVTVANTNGSNMQFVPTRAEIKTGSSGYQQIFYGTNPQVNPGTIVFTKKVVTGETIRFGGKYYYNRQWGPYFNSQSGTNNVRTLVNGDIPPTTYPLHTAPTLESFIRPYLDASGKVKIGPMDVIVFMELTHTDAQINDQGYDLQDMVLLVTFRTITTQPKP